MAETGAGWRARDGRARGGRALGGLALGGRAGGQVRVGTAVLAASLLVGGAPAYGGIDAPDGGRETGRHERVRPPAVAPVRVLPDQPVAAVAPARGELWLLENSGPTRPVVLEHLKSGRWSSEEIAPPGAWPGPGALAATARDDVWLSAVGTLRHYDGSRWLPVSTPRGPGGAPLVVGALATAQRGVLYAALSDPAWSGNARLFRYDGRRWQDLGSPSGASLFVPRRIVVFDAGVAVLAASYRAMTSYDLVGGAWSAGRLLGGVGGGGALSLGAYDVARDGRHLAFGSRSGGGPGMVPTCQGWTLTAEQACATGVVAGAAARLKNGALLVGGNDYWVDGERQAPGRFVLRGRDGTEREVAGDPGDATLLMVTEAHQNAAWAVTVADRGGPVYTLQRYGG